jgi:hypothetical protein
VLDVIVSHKYLHACCSRLRKLSKLPASGASRRQARKFIQGTSPVEMKRIREEILGTRKVPRFTRSERRLQSYGDQADIVDPQNAASAPKIACSFMRPICVWRREESPLHWRCTSARIFCPPSFSPSRMPSATAHTARQARQVWSFDPVALASSRICRSALLIWRMTSSA